MNTLRSISSMFLDTRISWIHLLLLSLLFKECHGYNVWADVTMRAIVIGAIIVGCGLFSLGAWLCCMLYDKCRKDRVADNPNSEPKPPPIWSSQLAYHHEIGGSGFGFMSDGLRLVGPGQVMRTRTGHYVTDGAKWAAPLTGGRHVFEITWCWPSRGTQYAGVGIATSEAPISGKKAQTLVGSNPNSWGLDIVKRRTLHNNRMGKACPSDGSFVPDRFLMYVDLEDGKLGFGNDVTYWGDVIEGLPRQGTKPLFVMIATSHPQAELSVVYKGSATGNVALVPNPQPIGYTLPPPMYPPTYTETDPNAGLVITKPSAPEQSPKNNNSNTATSSTFPDSAPPGYNQNGGPSNAGK